MDDIFCKIIRREIPADIVYEDEGALAFLDINPNNPGHTLVIPKKHVVNIFDADDEALAAVMHAARKVAPAVKDAVGAAGMNMHSNHEHAAGQVVFHLHFHLIPRFPNDGFELWPKRPYAPGESEKVGEEIRKRLG